MTARQREAVNLMTSLQSPTLVAARLGITRQEVYALLDRAGHRTPTEHAMRAKAGKQRCESCRKWCRKDASGRSSGRSLKRFCAKDENYACWRERMTEQRRRERGPSDKDRMRAAIAWISVWRRERPRKLDYDLRQALATLESVAANWGWIKAQGSTPE